MGSEFRIPVNLSNKFCWFVKKGFFVSQLYFCTNVLLHASLDWAYCALLNARNLVSARNFKKPLSNNTLSRVADVSSYTAV
jgi:hypothetical protein